MIGLLPITVLSRNDILADLPVALVVNPAAADGSIPSNFCHL